MKTTSKKKNQVSAKEVPIIAAKLLLCIIFVNNIVGYYGMSKTNSNFFNA